MDGKEPKFLKIGIEHLPLPTVLLSGETIVDYNFHFKNLFPMNNNEYKGKSIKEIKLLQINHNFNKLIESIHRKAELNDFELKLWNNTPVFATTSFFEEDSTIYTLLSLSKVTISVEDFKQIILGNRNHLKQILDSFQSYICIVDRNKVVQLCNQGFETLFNKSSEEIIGKSLFELFPSQNDINLLIEGDDELFAGTTNKIHLRFKFIDPRKKEHFLEITKTKVDFNNSEYIVHTGYDTTELDFFRQFYEESSALYKALIENTFDAIYLMRGRRYVWVNPRFCELTGYTSEELTNENFDFEILIPEETKKILEERYQARLAGKEIPNTYELQLLHKSGKRVFVEVSTVSVGKPNEVVVMGIIRDITQRKQYELKLLEQQERLRQINTAKDKLFNIIAHDLRSPISGLITLTQTLIHNSDLLTPEELKELLQELLDFSNQSLNLLENLLQWARTQTGTIQFNPEIVDLWETSEAARLISLPYAQQKEISIKNYVEQGCYTFGDKNMLNTILRNLVSNAVKFTQRGGEISISIQDLGNNWQILVSDTGVGMSQEQLSRLFKLGETQTTLGTNNEKGSGLGLLLVKELTEKNGGTISVESKEGIGTTFKITIPKIEINV